jgi:hypothetical protein
MENISCSCRESNSGRPARNPSLLLPTILNLNKINLEELNNTGGHGQKDKYKCAAILFADTAPRIQNWTYPCNIYTS